ncbi:MAG: sulfurtransferase TusA family protein [Candidatus Micrarchaeota archaeon]|jgi:Predicted redox protein, regulator of disulfide bond formation
MANIVVDARGSSCPGPVVELSKAYRNAKVGDIIEVWATDPGIKADAKAWADKTKNQIIGIKEEEGVIKVSIKIVNR